MRENCNDIHIPISPELGGRVEAALGEVRRLHRHRMLRRAGTVLGSFVAVMGALLGLAVVNPAMASQVPLVGEWLGGLFYESNYESKTGSAGAFLETYSSALEDVGVTAATESQEWGVTFHQGYTDGNMVLLSLSLTGPQEELEQYAFVTLDGYGQSSLASINGEPASIQGVNTFEKREGSWSTTMAVAVPESQQGEETLEVAVTLQGLEGQAAGASAASGPTAHRNTAPPARPRRRCRSTCWPRPARRPRLPAPWAGCFDPHPFPARSGNTRA